MLLKNLLIQLAMLMALLFLSTGAGAQQQAIYNATLDGYNYPYPVQYFQVSIEGNKYRMAYMDVAPVKRQQGTETVVLLHGKNFIGAYWQHTIKFLSENGYRVIVPDQVGFGKSDKPVVYYNFHQLAHNTRQLLESLQVKSAVIVGHSMGGMLATRFALMYPEQTSKLVLENPIGLEDYRLFVPFKTMEELMKEEMERTEESVRNYHKTYYTSWKPDYEEWVRVTAAQFRSPDYSTVARVSALTYGMIYQQPVVYEFSQLKMPVMLVIGQEDRTIVGKGYIADKSKLQEHGQYPELGHKTAGAIPNASLVALPAVGHIPHLEAKNQFHKALAGFLAREQK